MKDATRSLDRFAATTLGASAVANTLASSNAAVATTTRRSIRGSKSNGTAVETRR